MADWLASFYRQPENEETGRLVLVSDRCMHPSGGVGAGMHY